VLSLSKHERGSSFDRLWTNESSRIQPQKGRGHCGLHPGPGDEGAQRPDGLDQPPGLLEERKNLLEALRAQAGERLEHATVAGNLGVADHWGFLCWSCLQYSTGGSITDRV
jgi:hypothetical protein